MVDARLPGAWATAMKFDSLSDRAWRVFTYALMWSAENGTDGFIPERYTSRLHPDGRDTAAEKELAQAGIWRSGNNESGVLGWHLPDWDGALGQSTALQVATNRANAAKRQRAYRERVRSEQARAIGFEPSPTVLSVTRLVASDQTSHVTRDVASEVTPHVGKGEEQRRRDEEPLPIVEIENQSQEARPAISTPNASGRDDPERVRQRAVNGLVVVSPLEEKQATPANAGDTEIGPAGLSDYVWATVDGKRKKVPRAS